MQAIMAYLGMPENSVAVQQMSLSSMDCRKKNAALNSLKFWHQNQKAAGLNLQPAASW
jgi:hypothetical protein